MSSNETQFETRCLSSLSKVFADQELQDEPFLKASALANETYSFQVAYRSNRKMDVGVRVESKIHEVVTIRSVGLVPSEFPLQQENSDESVLRSTPGLFPDPLYLLEESQVKALPGQWRALWVTVDLKKLVTPGSYDIEIIFESGKGDILGSETFQLEVIPAKLPKQKLIHTEWFHVDCLSTYYQVDVFSERHWELIENYIKTAVDHGVNMILTPIFTPPLDTEVGKERPTVQLVDVEKSGQDYRFDFGRLQRWVDLCQRLGVYYFEFSHLFTQWGAKHAPKIIATENGKVKQIFGWETDASGDEYKHFLTAFLQELTGWIRKNHLEKKSYFHISDEPSLRDVESYQKASQMVRSLLNDFPIIDAMSDYEFYKRGLIKNPIPANNAITPFLEHEVTPLWTYYCSSQHHQVSNRFFAFPSQRNRILGIQLYKFNVKGFLHWGFNFYYTQFSGKAIDPFRVTDAGQAFPSGDSFLVYPGETGPIESLRLEVLNDASQDLRSLELLESLIGRDAVLAELEKGLDQPITFSEYPKDAEWLLNVRERVNEKIRENS